MNRPYDFVPARHNFHYIADITWPSYEHQRDWINSVYQVETWLQDHHMMKYSHWMWNWASQHWEISVAFRYDKHRTLFLINWG
jgi:hypothetical protein